jgi:hypothetical protein
LVSLDFSRFADSNDISRREIASTLKQSFTKLYFSVARRMKLKATERRLTFV